jgi:hypothetical protein
MNLRKRLVSSVVVSVLALAFLPGAALAFDHLEITVINPEIVEARPSVTVYEYFDVLVRAVNGDGSTDTSADFINANLLSPDVPAVLPASGYLSNGERIFSNVAFQDDGQPVRLRVEDLDDGSVPFAEVEINCYDFVDHIDIVVPGGDKYVGQVLNLTITARDDENVPVKNFDDDMVLTPDIGHFTAGPTITVPGGAFVLGVASVDVVLQGTDTLLHQNTIDALNSVTYPFQPGPAAGSELVSPLYPGTLDKVVLLLPGEILTPGISPGKSGTPNAQISSFPFNNVDVYATDLYWNPVDSAPYPTLSWSVDDFAPGVSLPASALMTSNAELDQSITLMTSGLRQVTVQASGAVTASNTSNVFVNSAGLDRFVFDYAVFDTTAVQATTNPFQIRVRAFDSFDNIFDYNGPVSMRVRIGAADESADYLLTTSNEFVDGMLNANVQVTKRAFSVRLIIDSNTGVIAESGTFQVNAGPMEKVLFTYPGQTWTPGLSDPVFNGNIGVPNDYVAGTLVDPVVLRAVDPYGNLVSGSRTVDLSCPTGYYLLFNDDGTPNEETTVTLDGTLPMKVIFTTAGDQILRGIVSGLDESISEEVEISPNIFTRMMIAAPGESLDQGALEPPGKLGTPTPQDAGTVFSVDVFATDMFYNPVLPSDPVLPIDFDFASSDLQAVLPGNPQTLNTNTATYGVTLRTLEDPNEQIISVEDLTSGATGSVLVPVEAGVLDHFDVGVNDNTNPAPGDALDPIPDHQAGSWLPNLTVIARDAFGNHINAFNDSVSLSVSMAGDVLSPIRISLQDGFGSGSYEGVWRGSSRITRAGVDVTITATDDVYGRTGVSNIFTVFPGAYVDLQVVLPGETATPGEAPGKFGSPWPLTAGDTVTATVTALDVWWNPVPVQPVVQLATSDFSDILSANNVALGAAGTSDFDILVRAAATQDVSVIDLAQPARTDTSTVDVLPGDIFRLMTIAPGETHQPGGPEVDGKTGTPDPQIATLQFPLTVRAVDEYWNLVDNNTDNVLLASDEGSLGPGNPLNNGMTLAGGEIIFPIALSTLGYATLSVNDTTDPTVLGDEVIVLVEEGAQYRITAPDTAFVGPPSTFPLTIELVDEFGVVMTNAFNDISIRAMTPTLQVAPGVLLFTDEQLDEGVVAIAAQAYDVASQIIIEVSDASGRLGYSGLIQMMPNGLRYEVTVDTSGPPIAGPPAVFPVTVRLLDTATGSIIDDDRFFDVSMVYEGGGTGVGALGFSIQRLLNGEVTFDQSCTEAGNFAVHVEDETTLSGESALFTIEPDGYKQLQILAPGEIGEPGHAAYTETGKSGTPTPQRSGEAFPLTILAVDQYWNPVDTIDTGIIHLASADNAFEQPNNPSDNDVPFVSGQRMISAFLVAEGEVAVTVGDLDDPGLPGQTLHMPILAPYVYEFTIPATAQTGGIPGFSMIVRMVDPDTGALITSAFNRVDLAPLKADHTPGSGVLGIDEVYLVGGVSVINDQSYSALEDLVVQVSDDFGRVAFSSPPIVMETGGLYYSIVVPTDAVVGGPASFDMAVELIDSNTGERVTGHDGVINMEVFNASTGDPGGGVLGNIQQTMIDGYALVDQTYSLAEEVYFRVFDVNEDSGVSNSCRMAPDGFKQLQIVAPGETPAPGDDEGDGKIGEPLVQSAGEPFLVELRAVDQFWNVVDDLSAGAIELTCSEPEAFEWQNPGDYHSAFVNGRRQVGVILDAVGSLTLYAADNQHPVAGNGQVVVPVAEAAYQIVVPDTANVGPPSTFPVEVRLVNLGTGETVPAGSDFTMTALKFDRTPATDVLGVTDSSLLLGEAVVTDQTYSVAEDIVIFIEDERGREAYSDVISVVPIGVTYEIVAPDTVIAGEPWPLEIRRVDTVTGRLVVGYDETFDVAAINAWSGAPRPDAGLTPSGVLRYTYGTTLDGIINLSDQSYDRAESIYLRVTDVTGDDVLSHVITVRAAAAQRFDVSLEELDGTPVDRVLRPDQQIRAVVYAEDQGGNATPGAQVTFTIIQGDASLGPSRAPDGSGETDLYGLTSIVLRTTEFGDDSVLMQIHVDDLPYEEILIELAGPPTTIPSYEGIADEYQDGWYVTFDSIITLSALAGVPEMGTTIYYDVNNGDGVVPITPYSDSFTLGDLIDDEPGVHVLRFYAEEDGGTREQLCTVNLYTAQSLTLEQPISNRPNPFRAGAGTTRIMFVPTASGSARITIYDLYGSVVLIEHLDVTAGIEAWLEWDGRNDAGYVVGNGGYICRVTGPGFDLRRKIAVVK